MQSLMHMLMQLRIHVYRPATMIWLGAMSGRRHLQCIYYIYIYIYIYYISSWPLPDPSTPHKKTAHGMWRYAWVKTLLFRNNTSFSPWHTCVRGRVALSCLFERSWYYTNVHMGRQNMSVCWVNKWLRSGIHKWNSWLLKKDKYPFGCIMDWCLCNWIISEWIS